MQKIKTSKNRHYFNNFKLLQISFFAPQVPQKSEVSES